MPGTEARTAKGRTTARRILDAAEAVIASEGHAGATTRRIATEAGVDKRVLAYYFESRESLLADVVGRTAARVAETIEREIGAVPAEDRSYAGLLNAVWQGICSEPALVRTYVAILATGEADTGVRQVIDAMNRDYAALLRRELVALGRHPDDARRVAAVAIVMIRGLLLSWVEGASATLVSDTLAVLARMLEHDPHGSSPP